MQLTTDPFYFSYRFDRTPTDDGRELEVSAAYPNPDGWLTIPWNNHVTRPVDPAAPAPTVGGWTLLHGPAVFQITAEIGLMDPTPLASAHIGLADVDQDGQVVAGRNAWEWEIAEKEGNTAHLNGTWCGNLAAGRRLWLRCDYWHAPAPALMYRANVTGIYWRPPAPPQE
ncbi:hypothetical protein [Actinomadura sp. 21ATH]|uniref:hypothetical protein n=1 Tax=Actinomadura sp. 21ATH TaxID=1735444 RepID=UPI0035BF13F7